VDGVLTGTVRNDGQTTLETPAVVLGSSVKVLKDLAPGEQVAFGMQLESSGFGQILSDRIFGPSFFDGTVATSETMRRDQTRHMIVDQLTLDPQFGNTGRLSSDGPVILAWGRAPVLDVRVEGQGANQVSNVLYYVPVPMAIRGRIAFQGDLLTNTIVQTDAGFMSKDPTMFAFGRGSATVAYRPLPFTGTLAISHVRLAFGFGGEGGLPAGGAVVLPPIDDRCMEHQQKQVGVQCPKPLAPDKFDGVPDVEVFDRTGAGTWHRLVHPSQGRTYELADPAKYVDATTGTLLIRYVNDVQDNVSFGVNVSIEGTIK
jgi:hypothetical protein